MPKERYQQPTLKQTESGVWFIRPWVDVVVDGKIKRAKKTIPLGSGGKRDAIVRMNEVMGTINRADYVISSQMGFGDFVEQYKVLHVERLGFSSRRKYLLHIKNHIVPAFGKLKMGEVDTLLVQQWLNDKGKGDKPLAWTTRCDIRNILSSIFTKAIEWKKWKDVNPIEHVHVGRKRMVREKRKLTDEQVKMLLAALPGDVRLACCIGLFCTLRVSEIFGLQEKHLNFQDRTIHVEQRWYRGDIDETKTATSKRVVAMGYLADELSKLCSGDGERYVFQPKRQYILQRTAEKLGIYWKGFGWHSLRREAITSLAVTLGPNAVMRMAGHSDIETSMLYTLADKQAQESAVKARQETILGKPEGTVQ